MDWADNTRYVRTSATESTYTIQDPDGAGPGQPLVLTVTNTFLGTNTQLGDQGGWFFRTNDNLRTSTGVGGSGQGAASLVLHQSPKRDADKSSLFTGTSNKSVTTFEFSRPVTNLTFTIRDIDSTSNDFWDAIALVGPSFSAVKANSGFVIGNGGLASPFRADGSNKPAGNASTDGNVAITMPSVTTFEFHYWNLSNTASSVDGDQKVFLSSFGLDYKPC